MTPMQPMHMGSCHSLDFPVFMQPTARANGEFSQEYVDMPEIRLPFPKKTSPNMGIKNDLIGDYSMRIVGDVKDISS